LLKKRSRAMRSSASAASWLSAAELGDGPDYTLTHRTVLACGSRSWEDREVIREALASVDAEEITLIHGGARGADRLAAEVFQEMFAGRDGYDVRVFPPDWDRLGKRAGYVRNMQMLDEDPDLVLAFHDGESRGTAHTIREARRRDISVYVFEPVAAGVGVLPLRPSRRLLRRARPVRLC
jgi:hypothetical protein